MSCLQSTEGQVAASLESRQLNKRSGPFYDPLTLIIDRE